MATSKKVHKLRFLTASALFDGHDVAINMVRRWLQNHGAQVIHLGHNRSVEELVVAAMEEGVDAIAITSYQGGHVDYFGYLMEQLKLHGMEKVAVFGGGGGVISKSEAMEIEAGGVQKIYRPEDSGAGGLEELVQDMLMRTKRLKKKAIAANAETKSSPRRALGEQLIAIGSGSKEHGLKQRSKKTKVPIFGFTGTGGAGKSTLIDEFIKRCLAADAKCRVAVLCIDPSRASTGGALLGDRMRYNSALSERVFIHSVATSSGDHRSLSQHTKGMLGLLSRSDFDLVILETAGIGQSDYSVEGLCRPSIYVMSSDYGAPTQLEKINMFDYADFVVLNKYDHRGAQDAFSQVRKAFCRSRAVDLGQAAAQRVVACCADQNDDRGVNALFNRLRTHLPFDSEELEEDFPSGESMVQNANYLEAIGKGVEQYRRDCEGQAELCHELQLLRDSIEVCKQKRGGEQGLLKALKRELKQKQRAIEPSSLALIESFERDYDIEAVQQLQTQSGLSCPRVAFPKFRSHGDILQYMMLENRPGQFPYSSGLFAMKRKDEFPTRMFAGEGSAEQTNARFHLLCEGQSSRRLSTAFDSLTLYGHDPHGRPDIHGKIGNSGVSVCCLDDMKRLYSGFDLCAADTSVSMTINGPAIVLLAFYFNTAVDAEVERRLKSEGRWPEVEAQIEAWFGKRGLKRPKYRGDLPAGHDGSGLGFLGLSAETIVGRKLVEQVKAEVLPKLRGTLQADIFKEEQAQNTCLYSREFSLELMADVQAYFVQHHIDKYYSVSVSGYHIAEAGANPITELAFTLANGFALVELYRSKGLNIEDFAPNFSFFFSNGMEPEYAVLGQVARRIWAVAMRDVYGVGERCQKLKYHIQTSGRSLHAQHSAFNDIRTTLEAFYATCDNCNSLHTNAYDEAISTPTAASVRQALAIQMILNQEYGLCQNDNPLQGSYLIRELSQGVEREVLREFKALNERGGVLGAMDYHYQRNKIQEEAMAYESAKAHGEIKIIGVNTFTGEEPAEAESPRVRSSWRMKKAQVKQVRRVWRRWAKQAKAALAGLGAAKQRGEFLFPAIMEASKYCTLGQISGQLMELGGRYRRSM